MKDILTDEEFEKLEDAPEFLSDEDFDNLPDEETQISSPQEIPETGLIEAGLRGVVQGLTFDTADEIAALAESTFGSKSYDQALKESRAEYKLAEEEYPVTSMLGGIAGGIGQAAAVTAATGGVGALAGAGRLKKIADSARALYLPTTNQSALKNIATAAKTGAVMSGLTSIGASEKEGLERLKEVPGSAATGAIFGGALGGVSEGIKKGVGKINQMADAGNLPYSLIKARDIIRAGKQGQGYITRKSLENVDKKFMDAADESVNLIQTNLDDLRNIKKEILKNTPTKISGVKFVLKGLKSDLEDQVAHNLQDAQPALNDVSRILKNLELDENNQVAAETANNIINQLDDYRFIDNLSSDVKNSFKKTSDQLKLYLRSSISPLEAFESVEQNPEMSDLFKRYLAAFPEEELQKSKVLAKQEQEQAAALYEELSKNKKIFKQAKKQTKKSSGKKSKGIDAIEYTEDVLKQMEEFENIYKERAKSNPLGQLDAMMHSILNASEDLGKVTRGQGTDLQRKFKIFDIMRGTSSDTGTGQKASEKYKSAVENLYKSNKELGKKFEEITKPRILDMENKKFLQGAKLGEESKEGVTQAVVTMPSKIVGIAGNIAAQNIKSPVVSGMLRAKNRIDKEISESPAQNTLLQFFSKALESAIETKNESRRAAVLNTLSQYEYFRNIFNSPEE